MDKELLSVLSARINQEKERLINERLEQLGIFIDLMKEVENFTREVEGEKETIYYKGLRLITFITSPIPFDHSSDNCEIGFETKYY